jgi:hypothetical protein
VEHAARLNAVQLKRQGVQCYTVTNFVDLHEKLCCYLNEHSFVHKNCTRVKKG